MKKRTTRSTVALASALAGLPLALTPTVQAQRPTLEKPVTGVVPNPVVTKEATAFKFAGRYDKAGAAQSIVGIDNGAPVYQNARGELFSLDPVTGDMIFIPADRFAGFHETAGVNTRAAAPLRMVKWAVVKFGGGVTIVGVDAAGHVVNRNAQGEKFYLNPANGDMVMVP